MKSITSQKMKLLDRTAIERFGIPSLLLMENAGRGVADLAEKMLFKRNGGAVIAPGTGKFRPSILVVCGKGNNGGDGLVSARHLANRGFNVKIVLLGTPNTDDSLLNYRIIRNMHLPVFKIYRLKTLLKKTDLVIDGIFGVGLTRTVEGPYRDAISLMNKSGKPILAIDIPSGLDADTGKVLGIAVKARATGTLAVAKKGLYAGNGPDCSGKVKVIDISIPNSLISRYTTR